VKLTIIIPVYNEFPFIAAVLRNVTEVSLEGVEKEIIVVDDCSTDGTREFLYAIEQAQVRLDRHADACHDIHTIRVFYQDRNQGKGAAIRRGFNESSGEVILIQDADLEYDPSEYPKLLEPIQQGVADVVYGTRFLGGPHRVLYFWHFIGNKFLTLMSNIFSNLNLTDMETCYKVFRREVLGDIEFKENRFGFEPEITAKVAKRRCRIYEVPISYYGRTYAEGKKIGWRDGVSAFYCILRYNLFP
jgi:glycosyltransferase involved in cell wall biosynthesis